MAIKLQEEFGDALQVIFVESQGHGAEEIERYGLERKWFGGRALWTSERPVRNTSSGLPSFVLLDVDGRPILEGSSIRLASQMEEAIAAEVQKIRRGPEDAPKDLKDAARDLLRGSFGADLIEGRGERDTILGGSKNDTLRGGDGFDQLFGERGDDVLDGGDGDD